MMTNETLNWIVSNGGPLILLEKCGLPDWSGFLDGAESCDYDRACDIDGFLGKLVVGESEALVLGGPMLTRWQQIDDNRGAVLRVVYAPDLISAEMFFSKHLAQTESFYPELAFLTRSTQLVIFDAAYDGPSALEGPNIEIEMIPGPHEVSMTTLRPDEGTMLLVVEIRCLGFP